MRSVLREVREAHALWTPEIYGEVRNLVNDGISVPVHTVVWSAHGLVVWQDIRRRLFLEYSTDR